MCLRAFGFRAPLHASHQHKLLGDRPKLPTFCGSQVKVTRGLREEWFDPDLTVDTRLFLDPFLLLRAGKSWARAHDDLVAHFAHCYAMVAKAQGPKSLGLLR